MRTSILSTALRHLLPVTSLLLLAPALCRAQGSASATITSKLTTVTFSKSGSSPGASYLFDGSSVSAGAYSVRSDLYSARVTVGGPFSFQSATFSAITGVVGAVTGTPNSTAHIHLHSTFGYTYSAMGPKGTTANLAAVSSAFNLNLSYGNNVQFADGPHSADGLVSQEFIVDAGIGADGKGSFTWSDASVLGSVLVTTTPPVIGMPISYVEIRGEGIVIDFVTDTPN
ncbi:MAG TPA: hypothetical protein VKU00_04040 [Chthonomonadaceae bacterium]|nr:hypothetical protein [Chthonomonadaceae bacterium]